MKDTNIKQVGKILFLAIWFYALLSAIFQPMLNDCVVFWAWAQQVHQSTLSGMDAIESVWEIKGLLSRILYYQTYAITNLFTQDIYPYGQYVFHGVGILEICLTICFSLYLIPIQFLTKNEKIHSFFLITLGIFTLTPMANLQPEVWGIPIIILSFACLLRGSLSGKIIGGVILTLLFFLKTPMLLLAGSVFFGYLLINQQNLKDTIQNIWIYALSSLFFLIVSLVFINWLYPQELIDIEDASFYQSTLIHSNLVRAFSDWQNGFSVLWKMPIYLPFLIIGGISFWIYIVRHTWVDNIYMMMLWLFPYLYIVISNCYFQYHFCTFFFASIITIYLTKDYWSISYTRNELISILAVIFVGVIFSYYKCYFLLRQIEIIFYIIPLLLMAFSITERWKNMSRLYAIYMIVFVFVSNNSLISHSFRDSENKIKKTIYLNQQKSYLQDKHLGTDSILQLNAGTGPLWVKNPSYLRHFYPLPIERIGDDAPFVKRNTYIITKDKLLRYQGDWIVLDSAWFFANPHPDISKWMNSKYEPYGKIYEVHNNDYRLYNKHTAEIGTYDLYKKK